MACASVFGANNNHAGSCVLACKNELICRPRNMQQGHLVCVWLPILEGLLAMAPAKVVVADRIFILPANVLRERLQGNGKQAESYHNSLSFRKLGVRHR